MSSGSESAPQEYQVRRPVRKARMFFAAMVTVSALSLSFVAAGCGGGGGGSTTNPTPTPSTSATQSVVTGRVVDLYSNTGVNGVTVSLGGQTVTTTSGGTFTLVFPNAFAGGNLTLTAPSGSKGFASFLIVGSAPCSVALSTAIPAVAAGQFYTVNTLEVYDKDNQGNSAPPPPCLNGSGS